MTAPAPRRRPAAPRTALPAVPAADRPALAILGSLAAAFDASRYPEVWLRSGLDEARVQALLLAHLRARGCWCWTVDVGARALQGRAAGALRRAGVRRPEGLLRGRAPGGEAGLPDIHGIAPGGAPLFVEVKRPAHLVVSPKTGRLIQARPAGEPTPQQLAFLAKARSLGALAGVAWGPQDLNSILCPPGTIRVDEHGDEP